VLPKIRLLQVGDVHLPSAAEKPPFVDQKDSAFPVGLRTVISRTPLKTVFLRIFELLNEQRAHCVLFMGDLTDVGRLDGYKACARYIANALQIGAAGKLSATPVGIVPGNHDVDRKLALKPGFESKFHPLVDALRSAGLPEIPVRDPRRIVVQDGSATADIYLLNSCWGCGESEFIPDDFRKPIADAIEKVLSGTDPKVLNAYYNQQLDTPAFSIDGISKLLDLVGQRTPTALPVVVAHHNLLPQRMPRLAAYTELINSGALRSSLLELGRPVIYLHGHIHDDPVEIVTAWNRTPLIVVSAPEAAHGFNLIEVTFNRLGLPVTTKISPYRFDGSGVLKPGAPLKVPMAGGRRRSDGPSIGALYRKLLEHRECYWQDVVTLGNTLTPPVSGEDLVETIELLSSDGSIQIVNDDLQPEHWIVKAEI